MTSIRRSSMKSCSRERVGCWVMTIKVRLIPATDAQRCLLDLLRDAEEDMIGLTDEEGDVIGILITEEGLDEVLVRTPQFQEMMERSRASLETGEPISAEDLLAKLQAQP